MLLQSYHWRSYCQNTKYVISTIDDRVQSSLLSLSVSVLFVWKHYIVFQRFIVLDVMLQIIFISKKCYPRAVFWIQYLTHNCVLYWLHLYLNCILSLSFIIPTSWQFCVISKIETFLLCFFGQMLSWVVPVKALKIIPKMNLASLFYFIFDLI